MNERLTKLKYLLQKNFLIKGNDDWDRFCPLVKSIESKQDLIFENLFYLVADIIIGIREMEEEFCYLMLLNEISQSG